MTNLLILLTISSAGTIIISYIMENVFLGVKAHGDFFYIASDFYLEHEKNVSTERIFTF